MLFTVVSFAVVVRAVTYHITRAMNAPESGLSRIGKPGLFGYVLTALRFTMNSEKVLHEGWEQFSGKPFILPTIGGPLVVLGPKHVDVLRKSNDTVFNQPIAFSQALQYEHTLNGRWRQSAYHVKVLTTDVTRAINSFIPEVVEEAELATQDAFDPSMDSKPITLPVFRTSIHMIARISNRTILGTEMGRNKEFIHAIVNFASTLPLYALLLSFFPRIIRPIVYLIFSPIFGGKKQPKKLIIPYLEQRIHEQEKVQEGPKTIVDFLIPQSGQETMEDLAMRVMSLNFGSIHTTSIFFTQALFELAVLSEPDLESIRTEVIEALDMEGGWNKAALARFTMIDSLLTEVGRFHGISTLVLNRLAIRDGELEDGTRIPAGSRVQVYSRPAHFNPDIYPNPNVFDAFRFSKLCENGENRVRNRFAMLNNNYLPFGTGRHACPGRFLAAMVLKIMIAHLLLNYDISLPTGTKGRPKNIIINAGSIPDPKAHLVFKRRCGTGRSNQPH